MASTISNPNVYDGTTPTPVLGGTVDLGKVSNVQSNLSQTFVEAPLVNNLSTATILTSTSGALRAVKVSGVITAESFALLNTAKNNIEAFVDGSQLAVTTLVIEAGDVDDVTSPGVEIFNGTGIITGFTWKYGVDTRAVMDYSLEFIEGTVGGAT